MFDALRRRLFRGFGKSTRFPAPAVPDGDAAAALKADLAAFHERSAERFHALFLRGRPVPCEGDERGWLAACERAGLARRTFTGIYVPCVRVFPLYGAMIATDLLSHSDEDQVFSLMLEQVYVVRNMSVRPGDAVLELCVGSGVNSLFATDRAASVTAVDISERALAFARFNAALNPGAVPLDLRHGSLFEPLDADARYDVVLVNPPFELVPPGADHFLHSHGGPDGLDVVRAILADAPSRLAPGGRFEMVTATPATADRMLLADLLVEAFPRHRIELHDIVSEPIDKAIAQFKGREGFSAWRESLLEAGIVRLHLAFARAEAPPEPGEPGDAGLAIVRPAAEVAACGAILGEWG